MTVLVQLTEIHLAFPDKAVLGGVSLAIHRGEKMALVGENGTGKTCLFRIIVGDLAADSGQVLTSSGTRIGYLEQTGIDAESDDGTRTCLDVALEPFRALRVLEGRIEEITNALAFAGASEQAKPLLEALGEAQHMYEEGGGYTYRSRTRVTLSGLGLPERVWSAPVQKLSAGQKVRLALVRLLLGEHDLLLLDEPTNHLDLEARVWLEGYLARLKTAYVVASHDRRFLDAVATRVAHLDRGALMVYSGNYSAFRAQATQQLETAWKTYEKRQRVVRRLQEQARSYRDWSNAKEKQKRGAADKGYIGHRAAKLMKRSLVAQRRLEATIERMHTEKPRGHDLVAIAFSASEGHQLLWARDLDVGFDSRTPLSQGITLNIGMGDRLAVLGPNGSGKTTVLRTFLGEVPPLAGQVRLVPSAQTGYFDQETRQVPLTDTALRAVLDVCEDETLARTVMGRMRVRRESVHKLAGSLSAGERAKVLLARLILGGHNLLILDEPANSLDIETQDVLLEALKTFPGGIVFVSHDRHFIDTLATQVLELGWRRWDKGEPSLRQNIVQPQAHGNKVGGKREGGVRRLVVKRMLKEFGPRIRASQEMLTNERKTPPRSSKLPLNLPSTDSLRTVHIRSGVRGAAERGAEVPSEHSMEERLRKLGQKIDELIAKARGSKPAMDARVDAYAQALRAGVAEARKRLDEINAQQAAVRERTQAALDGDLDKLDAETAIVEAEADAALAQDRAAFEAAVKRALEGWRKRIDDLQSMAATRQKGARENLESAIQRLRERREIASGKLKEIGTASGAAFDELRKGVSNALHELHRAADEAASKFEELRR